MSVHDLRIAIDDDEIATILFNDTDESYKLQYTPKWQKEGFAISPHLPFYENFNSQKVKRFLENLIPEGRGLEDILLSTRISKQNIFAIIKAIGYDTSGALMFGKNENTDIAIFRPIDEDELYERIATIEEQSITLWDQKQRLSLAGVQEKLPVIIKNTQIGLGDGSLSSTHIMKFQTKKHANIVLNEFFCMSLAQAIHLNVAQVQLHRVREYPVLMVQRFDRIYADNKVKRLHVIDGCQILDLPSAYKYERNFGSGRDVKDIRNGASFSKLFQTSTLCEVPAKAKMSLLQWSLFNLIIGNSDAHGKNFSFFVDNEGIRATPYYDLLCILMYEGIEHDLAMAFGDEFHPEKIFAYQLREFAEDIDINYKLVSQTLKKLCDATLNALKKELISLNDLDQNEMEFVKKLRTLIIQRATALKNFALEMADVSW